MSKRVTLTAVVFTYNSAGPLLDRVFESIRWADKIIAIDMQSKDRTIELCSKYTDTIFVHNENENINANFNFGYQQASSEYILHISHDFIIPPELKDEILEVLSSDHPADIYEIGTITYFFGKPVHLSVWEQKKLPLLFRKGMVVYPTDRLEIWPKLLSSDKQVLRNRYHHYTADRISELVRKYNRYSDIEVRNNPNVFPLVKNPWLLSLLGIGYGFYNYIFRGGFRFG
ncbi:MAG: glycosyltransferase family 2 protein, partial [Candidatus Omnitrophica bacterium]|nr:glycosyltransferase family 2 protein [Candidatus Omnitrophota bacterium]